MREDYKLCKHIKDNPKLRKSFNQLAFRTFQLDFEPWYEMGFWKDNYIPFSLVKGEQVIANVSVNPMVFDCMGEEKHYIQIGTVMTDPQYRKQGLSRYLLETVIQEYKEKTHGIYLFANPSVLDFYPKFGFTKVAQYEYQKKISYSQRVKAPRKISLHDPVHAKTLTEMIERGAVNSRLSMRGNPGLVFFYLAQFMKDQVYWLEEQEAYAVAEEENGVLRLVELFSFHTADTEAAARAFGPDIKKVILGFTPLETEGYKTEEISEEEDTLFVLGDDFKIFREEKSGFSCAVPCIKEFCILPIIIYAGA